MFELNHFYVTNEQQLYYIFNYQWPVVICMLLDVMFPALLNNFGWSKLPNYLKYVVSETKTFLLFSQQLYYKLAIVYDHNFISELQL